MKRKQGLGLMRDLFREPKQKSPRPSRTSWVSNTLEDIEDQIWQKEHIKIRFRIYDSDRRYTDYPYKNALSGNFTILTFHNRIKKFIDDVPYDIIDGFKTRVAIPELTLSSVRATYKDAPRVVAGNVRY